MAEKLSTLFKFWLDGLSLLCPTFLRQVFKEKRNHIVIFIDDDNCIAKHYSDNLKETVSTNSLNIDNEIDRTALLEFISDKQKPSAAIFLCFPGNIVLKRNLSLPAAVKPDVRQALAFELNRKTPFTEDQVYFDFEAIEQNNKLNIDLYIAPVEKANQILEKYQSLNLSFDAISAKKDDGTLANINFTGHNTKDSKKNKPNRLTILLSGVTTILFLALLYLPLYIQEQNLEKLENDVAGKRKQAVQLQSLIKEKDIIFEQSHFLANKRAEQISTIEVINEITRAIPDDTWLNRLVIKSGKIQLQGESSNASSLLQVIESSEFFANAEFRSPITKNNLTKKDRFNLSADIIEEKSI